MTSSYDKCVRLWKVVCGLRVQFVPIGPVCVIRKLQVSTGEPLAILQGHMQVAIDLPLMPQIRELYISQSSSSIVSCLTRGGAASQPAFLLARLSHPPCASSSFRRSSTAVAGCPTVCLCCRDPPTAPCADGASPATATRTWPPSPGCSLPSPAPIPLLLPSRALFLPRSSMLSPLSSSLLSTFLRAMSHSLSLAQIVVI